MFFWLNETTSTVCICCRCTCWGCKHLTARLFDAVVSYALGIVIALQDVLQTADWQSCRLPVTSTSNVGTCACEDVIVCIPDKRRQETYAQSACWCSGLMLLTAIDGSDLVIWNPCSLEQLLGHRGLQQFLDCLSSPYSTQRCNSILPVLPAFEQQGIELMQVIAKCRSNYQKLRWDDAAILYSLYEPADWTSGKLPE